MSRVSQALREIDARRAGSPEGPQHSVNLLGAYAASRVREPASSGVPGRGRQRVVWGMLGLGVLAAVGLGVRWGLDGVRSSARFATMPAQTAARAASPDPSTQALDPGSGAPPGAAINFSEEGARSVPGSEPLLPPDAIARAGSGTAIARAPAPPAASPKTPRARLASREKTNKSLKASKAGRSKAMTPVSKKSVKGERARAARGSVPPLSRPPSLSAHALSEPPAAVSSESVPPVPMRPRTESVEWLQAQARAALAAGETQDAVHALRTALRHDPMAHTARQALLAVLARGERGAAWVAALNEAVAVDPTRFGLVAARGMAEAGQVESALQALAAVPASLRQLDWYATQGLLAQRVHQHERAIESLTRALELAGAGSPKHPALRLALSESLAARGFEEQARQHLNDVLGNQSVAPELRAAAARRLKLMR